MIACCIGTVPNPTLDGEEATIDAGWLAQVEEAGCRLDDLKERLL